MNTIVEAQTPVDDSRHPISLLIEPEDNLRLTNLCGQFDQHIRQLEAHFDVEINNRAFQFEIIGVPLQTQKTINLLQELYALTANEELAPEKIHLYLQESNHGAVDSKGNVDLAKATASAVIRTKRGMIRGRGPNQSHYIRSIQSSDLSFGVGPAGTGKTYLP